MVKAEYTVDLKLGETMEQVDSSYDVGLDAVLESIKNSAKDVVPVQSGELRDSIAVKRAGLNGYVYTDIDYAADVEFGTAGRPPKPYMRPALDDNIGLIKQKIGSEIKRGLG